MTGYTITLHRPAHVRCLIHRWRLRLVQDRSRLPMLCGTTEHVCAVCGTTRRRRTR